MSYRRRHRWFRRLALGLAFATAMFAGRVSVAAATLEEGTGSRAASTAEAPSVRAPDGRIALSTVSPRPDDRSDRFSHVDAVTQSEPAGDGWTVQWDDAVLLGIGALVLAVGLSLALGYPRRTRLAGV